MKHKPKAKGSIIAALDVGSSKIACFIARIVDDEGNFEVLGVGHQASQGVKAGSVIDLDAAESAIRQTVHAAENMAADKIKGFPLREVIVNVPGVHTKSHNFTIDVEISGQDVTDNDVRRALAKAQGHAVSAESELIHTIPITYTIDGNNGIREPRGMFGHKLEVDVHLVTGEISALRNIATCIERSHLDIAALCESGYAAGLASLVEDEMDLGCTVIDMGGGVTSIAVFYNGGMIYSDSIPVGGRHVTSDIARGLTTSISDAERLKVLYGSAVASSTDENELIDVPQIGEDNQTVPNHAPRSLLVGIIQPRLEEILELVRAKLNDSGVGPAAGRRVILTGGASQMPGLRELGQQVLDKQVRLGRPIRIDGLADAVNGPAFATTAGLLTYIAERSDEMPAEIMAMVEPGNLFERVKFWLRENW
ncbi:MAG: cell division protein FtsA [Rhodospirillales bacterium]|nr:cell division protein FtsA [Rhodospirillales bacterium]MCB9996685.1 cell division protein FtsA [Rhodospirillales bacterium]